MSQLDSHPITAYVFTIGRAIFWSLKQQDIACLFTTEAEYITQQKKPSGCITCLTEYSQDVSNFPLMSFLTTKVLSPYWKMTDSTRTPNTSISVSTLYRNMWEKRHSRLNIFQLIRCLQTHWKLACAIGLKTYKAEENYAFMLGMGSCTRLPPPHTTRPLLYNCHLYTIHNQVHLWPPSIPWGRQLTLQGQLPNMTH